MARAKANGMLTLDQILESKDVKEETVAVPEWGGSVKIRGFTKNVEMQIRESARVDDDIDRDKLEMLYLIHGMVEPQATEEHIILLAEKSAAGIDRVLRAILKITGVSEAAKEEAKRSFPEGRPQAVPVPAGEGSPQDSGAAEA